ncbi:MAG: hypothetical protein QF815_02515 [Candidatus Peribacteraceae bacterium]|nr:hypothetical protein [Candidatus Peribacteraceae bacterium]
MFKHHLGTVFLVDLIDEGFGQIRIEEVVIPSVLTLHAVWVRQLSQKIGLGALHAALVSAHTALHNRSFLRSEGLQTDGTFGW